MDVGLRLLLILSAGFLKECFNPCFSGCWSATGKEVITSVVGEVSILVLVDVGLRPGKPTRVERGLLFQSLF